MKKHLRLRKLSFLLAAVLMLAFSTITHGEGSYIEEPSILMPTANECLPVNTDTTEDAFLFAGRGCCSSHGGMSGKCRDGRVVCKDGTVSPSCKCFKSDEEAL